MMGFVLALVMVLAVLPMGAMAAETDENVYNGTESITYKGVTFQRQQGGTYDGLPLFDAEPDHLDEYLDVYMDYIGLDGMVRIGLEKRNDYTLVDTYTISESYADAELAGKTITWENKNAGKVIPGSPQFSSPEAVQGYSTNFPAQIGVGQTWNKELVAREGHVVGTEKLYGSGSLGYEGSYLSTANQMVSTALTDMRINPLSGRIDEGYSEDAYHAAVMVDTMAAAVTGHDQAESDGGFWQMAFVDTKHFTNYLAQWQRNYGSFFNSARGLVEHVARSTYKAFSNDHISAPGTVHAGETFQVEVEVANQSDVPGYQVVQLYIAQDDSPYGDAAPIKKLVSFEKVWVPAVTSATAVLTVDPADFAVYTAQDQDLTVLSGEYTLMAGSSSDEIGQTASVTVSGDELAVLDSTERTDVFASAFAADDVYYREYSRQSTIDSLKADKVTEGYYTVVSKWEGSWVAIAGVNLYDLKSLTAEVGALEGISGTIDIRIGAPDGERIGTIAVPETGAHTYVLTDSGNGDNSDIEITELKHVQVEAELEDVSGLGTEDVYFVFNDAELRLASFTAEVSEQPEELPFEDVSEEQWFYKAVDYVYRNDLMNGVSDTRFAPAMTTTRGMVVTILWRMEGEPAANTELPFTDVAADAYYAEAIAWAAENGIVNGTSATTFHPDNDVLREQLAAMLYRYAAYKGIDTTERADLSAFVDADKISAYAEDAISWARANELIIGIGGSRLAPLDNANRAQIAQLIMNYCEAFGL